MFNDNGDSEVIEFAGEKERVLKDGAKNKHPVIGEFTQAKNETKKLVIVNAVETAEISRLAGISNEHSHQWLDENGWEERTSHVMTEDGTIYPVTLHIARARDGRNILYDVNIKINEGVAADKIATSLRAKKQARQAVRTTKPSGNKVTQQKLKVKKFSDRDYSYDALVSKPDMVVAAVGNNIPKNRADVVAMAKKNATSLGQIDPKTGSVSVHVEDIDADVIIGRDGLKHSLDRRFDVNAPVVLKAGEILGNSIRINELTPQKAEATESYVLIGAAKNDSGDLYVVRSVVNRFSNELTSMDVLYAINAKKEPAALLPLSTGKPALGTDSIISIASLLDYVNEYFPDILPEDVLKHYGHDARPEGKLGKDALYSDRDPDSVSNRSLLANAFEGVAQNDFEKQKIQEYKEQIELLDAQEQKLSELNAQIKELSFAKGKRDTVKIRQLRDEAIKTAHNISAMVNSIAFFILSPQGAYILPLLML